MKALIENGQVSYLFTDLADFSQWPLVQDRGSELHFTNVEALLLVSCNVPDGTELSAVSLVNGQVTLNYGWSSLAEAKLDLKNQVSAIRRQKEESGMFLRGQLVDTSRDTRMMLTSTFVALTAGFIPSVQLKIGSTFSLTDLQTLTPFVAAISTYVAGLFATEAQHYITIDSLVSLDQCAAYDVNSLWA